MKKIITATVMFSSALLFAEHKTHEGHTHVHSQSCEHAKENHAGHVDYYDNGHDHVAHEKHFDEEQTIKVAQNHKHEHGPKCGHESRTVAGLTEYKHDGVWHHKHGEHYHEAHTM